MAGLEVFDLHRPAAGTAELPLLVSVPHTGEAVPADVAERFASDRIRELPDTDRHLHRLYDFVPGLGATLLCARFNRFVVDLNRPATGEALYPGRDETGLVPTSSFGSEPIYRQGTEPDADEVRERVVRYWQPYHDCLTAELGRIRERFGYALLWDGHSIRSRVPRFFDGELPGLMLGDALGTSAAPELSAAVVAVHRASGISCRANDPFRGGFITRNYGDPARGVHALQLEMSQRLYMDEDPPFSWAEERARALQPVLERSLLAFAGAAAARE